MLNSNIFPTSLQYGELEDNMVNFGLLAADIVSLVRGTRANSTGFASWLRCSDVAHRRPTKLCMVFGRLLGCFTIYTISEALAP